MMRNRILIVLWFVCIAFAGVYTGVYLYAEIFAVSGIVVAVSFISNFFTGKKIKEKFNVPKMMEKGDTFRGSLSFENQSWIPVFAGKGNISCKNTFTGEENKVDVLFSMTGKQKTEVSFQGKSQCCGCINFSYGQWKNSDFLRLFVKKRQGNAEAETVIIPPKYIMNLSVLGKEGFDMESFRYSGKCPGDDPGETYDIREYREGDSIRQIHWKLTEKLDNLMIRERSYPVDDAVLIIAEPFREEMDSQCAEAVVEIFAALLQSFIDQKIPCQAGVYDRNSGHFYMEKIRTSEDYENILYLFLHQKGIASGRTVVEEYLKNPGGKRFSNYIYVTGDPGDQEGQRLKAKGALTVIRCGEKAGSNMEEITVTKEQFRKELGIRAVK